MPDREKVIKGLECCNALHNDGEVQCAVNCPYWMGWDGSVDNNCRGKLIHDALALLKAQELATIEPKRIDLADETKAWLDKMDAVDALGNIADICIDWDGYRTANGLGGLINEIWAYARYCADKLLKAQEPVEPRASRGWYKCGACGNGIATILDNGEPSHKERYCNLCGRAVKWDA